MECRICKNLKDNKKYTFKERMFRLEETFEYFECSACGCLQIAEFPQDMSKYYPKNYYSYNFPTVKRNSIRNFLRLKRNHYYLDGKGIIGKIVAKFFPFQVLETIGQALCLNKNMKILDVGCGKGILLKEFREIGYKNLYGVDPYNEREIDEDFIKIYNKNLNEINDKFDVIMLHHSLEHIENQQEILQDIADKLKNDGKCLIRIPIFPSYIWEHYGENWMGLDPPRHFYLHSLKSINLLSAKVGLKVDKIIYDSNEFQFLGAEQFIKGIYWMDKNSTFSSWKNGVFSKKEVKKYIRKSKELNEKGQSDQIAMVLSKK